MGVVSRSRSSKSTLTTTKLSTINPNQKFHWLKARSGHLPRIFTNMWDKIAGGIITNYCRLLLLITFYIFSQKVFC